MIPSGLCSFYHSSSLILLFAWWNHLSFQPESYKVNTLLQQLRLLDCERGYCKAYDLLAWTGPKALVWQMPVLGNYFKSLYYQELKNTWNKNPWHNFSTLWFPSPNIAEAYLNLDHLWNNKVLDSHMNHHGELHHFSHKIISLSTWAEGHFSTHYIQSKSL